MAHPFFPLQYSNDYCYYKHEPQEHSASEHNSLTGSYKQLDNPSKINRNNR